MQANRMQKNYLRENFGGPYEYHDRRALLPDAQKCWPSISET